VGNAHKRPGKVYLKGKTARKKGSSKCQC
jgi:hypothetical protein